MSNQLFIRRAAARAKLGVSEQVFTKLVNARKLTPYYLTKGGRAHYATSQVEALSHPSTPTPNHEHR